MATCQIPSEASLGTEICRGMPGGTRRSMVVSVAGQAICSFSGTAAVAEQYWVGGTVTVLPAAKNVTMGWGTVAQPVSTVRASRDSRTRRTR